MNTKKLFPRYSSDILVVGYLLGLFVVITSFSLPWRLAYLRLDSVVQSPFRIQLLLIFGGLRKDLIFIFLVLALIFSCQILSTFQISYLFKKACNSLQFLVTFILFVFIAYSALVRIADLICFYYSGAHVDILTFGQLRSGIPGWSVVEPLQVAVVLAFLCLTLSFWLIARLLSCNTRLITENYVWSGLGYLSIPLFLLSLGAWYFPTQFSSENESQKEAYAKFDQSNFFPELKIISKIFFYREEEPTKQQKLSVEIIDKLRSFGLFINQEQRFPLVKTWVSKKKFPFPRSSIKEQKPNIVILFFESFVASLTSVYPKPQYPHITPALEAFARESTSIQGFYNSSNPTINGIKATLCSYSIPFHAMSRSEESNFNKNLKCLPRILQRFGFHTYAVLGRRVSHLKHDVDLHNSGIEHVIDQDRLRSLFGERKLSWGYSDHQIFGYLNTMIKQKMFKEPFFVILETIDSHPPFNRAKDEYPHYGDGSNPLLNAFRSTDHAFGQFWNDRKQDPINSRTITIALADHFIFPGTQFQKTTKRNVTGYTYGEIMLIIHNPLHQMRGNFNIISSQIDLAPTLLHLLGINTINHFEGLSIFGERQDYPQVLGMNELVFFTKQKQADEERLDYFSLNGDYTLPAIKEECSSSPPPSIENGLLNRCDFFRYYKWKRALHTEDRIWP